MYNYSSCLFFLPTKSPKNYKRYNMYVYIVGKLSNVKCLFMKCKIKTEINESDLNDYFVKII